MNLKYLSSLGGMMLLAGAFGASAFHCSSTPAATTGLDPRTTMLLARGDNVTKPITDVHVHLYQPSRPGVEWPDPGNATIYKDTLPLAPGTPCPSMTMPCIKYQDDVVAKITGGSTIVGSGIVEASPRNDDTQWLLSEIHSNPFFTWYVAQLDMGTADFITNLNSYLTVDAMANPDADKIVGLRVYLWGPSAGINLSDPIQTANLEEVQKRGLTLDIISRGVFDATGKQVSYTNPKANVIALATKYPGIRIIIDHLGGAKQQSADPDPNWAMDMKALGKLPNVYMKLSAFFDTANATGDESKPWTAPTMPTDVASYAPLFDEILADFGEDRVVWGSNWPVVNLAGTVDEEIQIAEAYFAQRAGGVPVADGGAPPAEAGAPPAEAGAPPAEAGAGTTTFSTRDKVMFRNAALFYRRVPAGANPTMLSATTTAILARGNGVTKPILDGHIHIFQPSRPGVEWPDPANATLFKDMLPAQYHAATMGMNFVNTCEIEASPRDDDTLWVLNTAIKGDSQFFNYSAQLDIGSKDFITNLDAYATNNTACMNCGDMVAGLRIYLWGPAAGITLDATQTANLTELQKRGMTVDIISRGVFDATGKQVSYTNPKAQVEMLATQFPKLRIIIDHLGGAKLDSANPDPNWATDMKALASHPNVYMKFSALFDTANATGDESKPWTAPKDWQSYQKIFDELFNDFGEDRLIFGSNWPVINLAGTVTEEVAVAEGYLATKTQAQRDKVMFRNGVLFYRRIPPQ